MAGARRDAVDRIVEQWAVERPELDTRPMALIGRIYRIAEAVGARQEEVYGRFGISRGEFDVLATLRRAGPPFTLAPRDLSAALMITSGGVTGRLDKLEQAGLLRRTPDPDDRRGIRVTLTDEGFQLIDAAVDAGLEAQREIVDAAMSHRQATQLDDLLRLLLGASE